MNIKTSMGNEVSYNVSSPDEQNKLQTLKRYRHMLNSIPGMFLCGVSPSGGQGTKVVEILTSTSIIKLIQTLRSKVMFYPSDKTDRFFYEVTLLLKGGKMSVSVLNEMLQPHNITAVCSTGNPVDSNINVPEDIALTLFLYIPYRDIGDRVVLDSNFPVTTSLEEVQSRCIIEKYSSYTADMYLPLTAYSILGEIHPTDSELKFTSYNANKFQYLLDLQKKLILAELSSLDGLLG